MYAHRQHFLVAATLAFAGLACGGSGVVQGGSINIVGDTTISANTDIDGVSTWGNGNLTVNPGVTIHQLAGGTMTFTSQWKQLNGGGTYLNDGTFYHNILMSVRGSTFDSPGLFVLRAQDPHSDATGVYRFPGGTIQVPTGYSGGEFWAEGIVTSRDSGGTLKSVNLDVQGTNLNFNNSGASELLLGTVTVASGSTLRFMNANMAISSANPTHTITVDGTIQLGGSKLGGDATFTRNTSWLAGDLRPNGYTLTFGPANSFTIESRRNMVGPGTVVNQGTINMTTDYVILAGGVTFDNQGTFILPAVGDSINTGGVGNTLRISGNGVLRKLANDDEFVLWNGGTLDNTGTIEINGGTLRMDSGLGAVVQKSGASLTGGTWKVAGTNGRIEFSNNTKITTIGADATVILENGGTIRELDGNLTTVNGKFLVNGSAVFSDASGFSVGSTGTVGGSGTIAGNVTVTGGTVAPGSSPGTLSMNGALNLNNAALLGFELGDSLVPGASDHVDVTTLSLDGTLNITGLSGFGIPSGATSARYSLIGYQSLAADGGLVLGTNPGGPFDYVLGYTAGVGGGAGEVFLRIQEIPEPSTLALLSLAALGLRRRRPA